MIRSLLVALALAASGPSLAEGASVATIVVPTGLDDDDAKKLHARIDAQVTAAGGAPLALSRSLEVKDECLDDPSCARALLRAADAPWLLWVEALRAGPKVQIDARLLDAEGRTVKEGGGVVDLEDIFTAGRAPIPADVLAPLGGAPASVSEVAPEPKERPAARKPPMKGAKAKTPPPVTAPPPAQAALPPPLAIAGVAVAAAGAGISVVCLALIPGQLDVIGDATSLGEEKETAAILVPALAILAVGGVIVGVAGGAMVFLASE